MKEGKTRKSILEVAKALFEKFGYDKTSMNDIALHSHKAKGSLYYNFNSKMLCNIKLICALLNINCNVTL